MERMREARKSESIGKSGPSIRRYAFSEKEKKCEVCKYNEYECCLDVHHKDMNPNNNSLENLIILCVMCHRKVHRKLIKL
jgi:5-methylcytosine-specific restriction endonuclease McrA